MSRPHFCRALVFGLLVSSLSPAALADEAQERAAARTAADAGADAYERGKYEQSLELFSRAEALFHAPPHLLFMARSFDKLGRLVEAREAYLKLVREKLPPNAPRAFKNAQLEAEKELSDVEARLPYVTLVVQGDPEETAVASMDGRELPRAMIGIPVPIDPGAHVFVARNARAKSAEVRVDVEQGARQTVELALTEALPAETGPAESAPSEQRPESTKATPATRTSSTGSGQRTAGFVTLGAGALAAGVGTAFMVSSLGTRSDADAEYTACDSRPTGCTDDERAAIGSIDADADRTRNFAIVGFAVGGAAIVTGLVLVLTADSGDEHAASATTLRLVASPTWLGAAGTF